MNALGTHILLELRDCNSKLLDDLPHIRESLLTAARDIGVTVIGDSFHQFSPQGVTGVIAIAESHLCIHTWPEYGYAAVDIFTCGEGFEPRRAVDIIVKSLESTDHSFTEIERGLIPSLAHSDSK